ncbi:3'(2'),5'-bisphosphate nucleotidase CysQ [Luteibacter aegosomatissinici]|uniref:3'(2'),5'-bisphosphate nucleotidase CysQ n=1 Tax=Luteibacter aegosomatissinici TaxID=2911539 RepID=UPI001FF965D0|nr:3'(2'),5'-bisphosphate nucleotidase CysQ [Luteibacter aegosomatissinici]UPG93650.1 3'(2'),5'-bisphosphate nucleotidase CysQ [Luteibacter aegosomatissinici]
MTAPRPQACLDEVCAIAREAGDAILTIYAHDFEVIQKADASPVTTADLAAQAVIAHRLEDIAPGIPVISEEALAAPWAERRTWRRYWLVDPLDGTREFIKRNGEFTVNIALIEDHRSVLGVVLAPVTGDLYAAAHGQGAWRQQAPGAPRNPIRTRAAGDSLRVTGSRSHGGPRGAALLERLGKHETFALGSSLKFCVIARGDADIYLRLGATSEWDTAAAQCVLEEAGGAVLDLAGRPFRYNTRDSLINPEFIACGDTSIDWAARLVDPDH